MEKPSSYCQAVMQIEPDNPHGIYDDTQYGFPILDDEELFGRLILEINQAVLSWTTILNKQENFKKVYHQFNIKKNSSLQRKGPGKTFRRCRHHQKHIKSGCRFS